MARPARNRRTQLTSQSLFGVAEVCETRSLLCAAWFDAPVDVVDKTAIDASGEISDIPTPDDGTVTDEMLFSVSEAGGSEDDPRLEVCCIFPTFEFDTDNNSADLTGVTVVGDDLSPAEETTGFVDYDVETLPGDWDPSWNRRFFSLSDELTETGTDEATPDFLDASMTRDVAYLPFLESVDLPLGDDSMVDPISLEDSLNPEDLLAVCFRDPSIEETTNDVASEWGSDDVDVKSDDVVAEEWTGDVTEDWSTIPREVLMTMVLRGYVPDAGGEEIAAGEKAEDGTVGDDFAFEIDGENLWSTDDLKRCEDFPPVMYMFSPRGFDQQELAETDVIERSGDENVDGEVVMDEIYTMMAGTDDVPVERLAEESGLILQTTLVDDVVTAASDSETEDSAATTRSPGSYSTPNLFADLSDAEDAVGTLLARPGSPSGSGSVSTRSTTGTSTRTAPKLNAVVSRRSLAPVALQNLTSPLGESRENESLNSDADDSEAVSVSENVDSKSSESDSSSQSAVNASANSVNRTQSIDLFMSRFHDEFFAG